MSDPGSDSLIGYVSATMSLDTSISHVARNRRFTTQKMAPARSPYSCYVLGDSGLQQPEGPTGAPPLPAPSDFAERSIIRRGRGERKGSLQPRAVSAVWHTTHLVTAETGMKLLPAAAKPLQYQAASAFAKASSSPAASSVQTISSPSACSSSPRDSAKPSGASSLNSSPTISRLSRIFASCTVQI